MTRYERMVNRERNKKLKSIKSVTKEIYADRKNAALYNHRGILKSGIWDYIGAIEDYKKAIELDAEYAKFDNISTCVSNIKWHLERFEIKL